MKLQSVISIVYPPQCVSCSAPTDVDFSLCGTCWQQTAFISGLVCDACGMPLDGEGGPDDVYCDSCLIAPRPWIKGRAALMYEGQARKLILALKHGDRLDLVVPLAQWMAKRARQLPLENTLVAPVPLHRRRLFKRRFNQAALLAQGVAKELGLPVIVDLLKRPKNTRVQDGMSPAERIANLEGAFRINRRHLSKLDTKNVLLIDDVMTTGATLSACSEVLLSAGAKEVNVLALARVASRY